jgi:hypothetical protein
LRAPAAAVALEDRRAAARSKSIEAASSVYSDKTSSIDFLSFFSLRTSRKLLIFFLSFLSGLAANF